MKVLETERLVIRHLTLEDAPFILRLVNEPSWLQFIGDRGVRNQEDARNYIANGPMRMIAQHGFGLYLVTSKEGVPMGMCGLIRRKGLEDVDIGFAFLPAFWGQGYAFEAASGVMEHARSLGLRKLVAIASFENVRSAKLLGKLGMKFIGPTRLPTEDHDVALFTRDLTD